jgi:uncharacterized membrane protein YgaE (UPF0421/DUF939 family)
LNTQGAGPDVTADKWGKGDKAGQMGNTANKKHPLMIGMRTLKTALSVLLCIILYNFTSRTGLTGHFDAFLACVSAIICVQDSMEKSLDSGLSRVYGTGLGAALGIAFLYIDMAFKNEYLIIAITALGIIVIITVCNALNISDSIVIACVVFLLIVMVQSAESPIVSSMRRFIDTVAGIGIGIVVNHFIHNPDAR